MKGSELKKIRLTMGLTQVQLAKELGVTSNALARWERSERRIWEPVARLATFLSDQASKSNKRRAK